MTAMISKKDLTSKKGEKFCTIFKHHEHSFRMTNLEIKNNRKQQDKTKKEN